MERDEEELDLTPPTEQSPEATYPEIPASQRPNTAPALAEPAPSALLVLRGVVAAMVGLILPGLGHVILGKWIRGITLFISILAMFAIGAFWMEGRLHLPNVGEPVSIFPFIANAGLGGIYLICYLTHTAFGVHAEASTYEYGNTFLFVAGLLNFLTVLDAYDIGTGKKS